jgi:hypothetical protein
VLREVAAAVEASSEVGTFCIECLLLFEHG